MWPPPAWKKKSFKSKGKLVLNSFLLLGITHPGVQLLRKSNPAPLKWVYMREHLSKYYAASLDTQKTWGWWGWSAQKNRPASLQGIPLFQGGHKWRKVPQIKGKGERFGRCPLWESQDSRTALICGCLCDKSWNLNKQKGIRSEPSLPQPGASAPLPPGKIAVKGPWGALSRVWRMWTLQYLILMAPSGTAKQRK